MPVSVASVGTRVAILKLGNHLCQLSAHRHGSWERVRPSGSDREQSPRKM